jgi:lysophospholipase L1-like esterase
MQQGALCLVVFCAVLAVICEGSNNMECTLCTISLGIIEQKDLQLKLKDKLLKKCDDGKKLLKKECEKAVGKVVNSLLEKARPETLCDKMNFCDGWQQCQLYPEWPLNSLPPSPKEWPTERRRELLELSDFRDHQILKDWFTGILKEYKITQGENDFFAWTSVLSSVLHDLHHDDDAEQSTNNGNEEGDDSIGCDKKDVKCHIDALAEHKPLQDQDGDFFGSTKAELRGTDWRGVDCDDGNKDVYPGRKTSTYDASVDHNCNGIVGGNETASYEEIFCSGSEQRGLIMLGDSATAHFHLPPQWLTADGWNLEGARQFAANELDFPQCSWGTGHVDDATKCPYQYPLDGISENSIISLYTQMRERNLCQNSDFQNVGVNGARMTSSMGLIDAMARDKEEDHKALVWLTLLGNDVCNGYPDTVEHMTTPENFYDKAMESLNRLDTLLPDGSYVVSTALFDGELLYDTMHAQQHPLGPSYANMYDYMNCMEVSPCLGWLNSNATTRAATTQRAKELDQVYQKIVDSQTFKSFKYIYFQPDWHAMFDQFAQTYGTDALPRMIEAADGFHPSQTGNAVFAQEFFKFLEQSHPDAIGPINPHNDEIKQMFFSH